MARFIIRPSNPLKEKTTEISPQPKFRKPKSKKAKESPLVKSIVKDLDKVVPSDLGE